MEIFVGSGGRITFSEFLSLSEEERLALFFAYQSFILQKIDIEAKNQKFPGVAMNILQDILEQDKI